MVWIFEKDIMYDQFEKKWDIEGSKYNIFLSIYSEYLEMFGTFGLTNIALTSNPLWNEKMNSNGMFKNVKEGILW